MLDALFLMLSYVWLVRNLKFLRTIWHPWYIWSYWLYFLGSHIIILAIPDVPHLAFKSCCPRYSLCLFFLPLECLVFSSVFESSFLSPSWSEPGKWFFSWATIGQKSSCLTWHGLVKINFSVYPSQKLFLSLYFLN